MKRPKSLLGNRDVEIPFREIESGILIADKPKGISSFDVIRVLRKKLNIEKMGHAGTLDPNASGLMILAYGSATKRLSEFLKLPKTYEADILLGVETDTGDTTGIIIREEKDFALDKTAIQNALQKLIGAHILPVPAYSAIKMAGKSLYQHTLEGTLSVHPAKEMTVNSAKIISVDSPHVSIQFDVESGTYIRSLAEEIGRSIGIPTTLANLRRTRVGKFSIEDFTK